TGLPTVLVEARPPSGADHSHTESSWPQPASQRPSGEKASDTGRPPGDSATGVVEPRPAVRHSSRTRSWQEAASHPPSAEIATDRAVVAVRISLRVLPVATSLIRTPSQLAVASQLPSAATARSTTRTDGRRWSHRPAPVARSQTRTWPYSSALTSHFPSGSAASLVRGPCRFSR